MAKPGPKKKPSTAPKSTKNTKTTKKTITVTDAPKAQATQPEAGPDRSRPQRTHQKSDNTGLKVLVAILLFIPLIVLGSIIIGLGAAALGMIIAGIAHIPVSIIALTQNVPVGLASLGAGFLVGGLGIILMKFVVFIAKACIRGLHHFFTDKEEREKSKGRVGATITWVFSLFFIISGIALLATSWGMGGGNGSYIYIDDTGIHVSKPNEKGHSVEINEKNLEKFSNLELKSVSANIQLIPSTSFGFEAVLPPNASELEWKNQDGTLTINTQGDHKWRIDFFSWGIWDQDDYQLKIYYPRNTKFDSINIDAVSGTIKTGKFTTKNLIAKTVSGEIDLMDIDWEDLRTETVSGDIKVSGRAGEKTYAKTVSGEIDYELIGSLNNYAYKAKSISGDIKIGNQRNQGEVTGGTERNGRIDLSTISGDITLLFD